MSLTGNMAMNINATLAKTINALQNGVSPAAINRNWTIKDGNASGEANALYAFSTLIPDGTDVEIDIAGGISDAYGDTITFTDIKAFMLVNTPVAGGTGVLLVGDVLGDVVNPWESWVAAAEDGIAILPDGEAMFADRTNGYGCATGVNDILRLAHDGTGAIDLTVTGVFIGVV